jgi:hypothetical protein
MFAVIDRSRLQSFSTTSVARIIVPANQTQVNARIQLTGGNQTGRQLTGTNANTLKTWVVQDGTVLVYEPNTDNEETVVVRWNPNPGQLEATFTRSHAARVTVIERGNPGPWQRYDPRKDPDVVLYFSIIH